MSSHKPILIIEDSIVTSIAVSRILERSLPDHPIVRAQSCLEARILFRIYSFSLVIIDVNLPDGCGLDLVPEILDHRPVTGIIAMTADDSPAHRQRSNRLGVQHFISKPIEAEALRNAALHSLANAVAASHASGFQANLRKTSLFDVVQLKCLNRSTCRLEISSASPDLRMALIDFVDGEITHAELCDSTLRKLAAGESALEQILLWTQGTIEESELPSNHRRTIFEAWQGLLLQAAQRCDEQMPLHDPIHRQPASHSPSCRKTPPLSVQPSLTSLGLPVTRCHP